MRSRWEEQLAKERARDVPSPDHDEVAREGRRRSYPHLVTDHGLPAAKRGEQRSDRSAATRQINAISRQLDDLAIDDEVAKRPSRSRRIAAPAAAPERARITNPATKRFDLNDQTDALLHLIEDMADRLSRSASRSDLDELRQHIADLGTLLRSIGGRSVRTMTFHRLLQEADRLLSDSAAADEVAAELQAFHARLAKRIETGWDLRPLEAAGETIELLQERVAACVEEDCLTRLREQVASIHAEFAPHARPAPPILRPGTGVWRRRRGGFLPRTVAELRRITGHRLPLARSRQKAASTKSAQVTYQASPNRPIGPRFDSHLVFHHG